MDLLIIILVSVAVLILRDRNDAKKNAKQCILYLKEKERPLYYEEKIEELREILKTYFISLSSLGINEEELQSLKTRCCILSVIEKISWIKGTSYNDGSSIKEYIDGVKKELKKNKLSFVDVKTSNKELEKLKKNACKIFALNFLCSLRKKGCHYETEIEGLRKELKIGNLSLAEIKTSERELEKLKKEYYKSSALEMLKALRESEYFSKDKVEKLKNELRKGNLTFSSIKTSEKEFENLKIKAGKRYAAVMLDNLRTRYKNGLRYKYPYNDHLQPSDMEDDYGKDRKMIEILRKELKNAKLPLACINTSEKELAKFIN